MTQVVVGRWRNNLAVRLPGEIVDSIRPRDGERVDIVSQNDEVVIRRAERPVTLASLFDGRTAQAWRAEYAGAYEWGPDLGREVVPE